MLPLPRTPNPTFSSSSPMIFTGATLEPLGTRMSTRQTSINWLGTACGSTVSLPPPPCVHRCVMHFIPGCIRFAAGAYPNHTMVDPETRSVFHHLKDLGYRVGLLGKTHISPAVAFPFENISSRTAEIDEAAAFFNRDEQQPWFMVFASNEPHAPWRSGPTGTLRCG